MALRGTCLCGKVSYKISGEKTKIGACHCSMCRRWSGGVFLGLEVQPDEIEISGAEAIIHYKSSDWAERGFCGSCGASLYYRLTLDGPMHGVLHVGVGTLEDANGLDLTEELFIDLKPDGYGFAQETHALTEAQVQELFGAG